jgi:hypothetical protein
MQDPMALRLFGELYGAQNLREDGGVSRTITSRAYIREKLGQSGSNVVWYFTHKTTYVTWGDVTLPHKNDWSKKELAGGKSPAETYFQRAGMLESAGLIEWVPYLFEGPEGEPIHPLAWNGMDMEKELYTACVAAGRALLTQGQLDHIVKNLSGGWLVPAPAHMAHVQMYGIARLRYRPHTRMTAAWWADYNDRCAQFTSVYKAIAAKKAASSAVG